jgi:membrane protease subunit (stomatin/prohibitin family)
LGDDWAKQQAANILGNLSVNPGAGGVAAAGAGMGMGMAAGGVFGNMAQQLFTPMQQVPVQQPIQQGPSGRFVQKSAEPAPAAPTEDPVVALQKLKTMLDAGLIPQEVYIAKMNEILSRM